MKCVTNIDQVVPLVRLPGQKYKGPNGHSIAATSIQSVIRMHIQKLKYKRLVKEIVSINKIIGYWKSYKLSKEWRLKLLEYKELKEKTWNDIQNKFLSNWSNIKEKDRIEIHIPSFSLDSWNRFNIPHLNNHENNQLSRLLRLRDPHISIVYVSPYKMNENIINYYIKLLKLKNIKDVESRLCFVYPENCDRFPDFFSLSSLILYSPNCMRFIKDYIRNRTAYILPNYLGPEDKILAETMKLPMLATDPTKMLIFTSKSGSQRIFTIAEVNTPIGIYNLSDVDEVVSDLCKLILKYLEVDRWIFKVY